MQIWFYAIQFALLVMVYLPLKLFKQVTGKEVRIYKSLHSFYFWNGTIRTFTQSFLELFLASLLNVITADWGSQNLTIRFSNNLALAALIASVMATVGLALLYFCKFYEIKADSSNMSVLDGLNFKEDKRSKWQLIFPFLFFARRIGFTLSVIYFSTFLWAQLAI